MDDKVQKFIELNQNIIYQTILINFNKIIKTHLTSNSVMYDGGYTMSEESTMKNLYQSFFDRFDIKNTQDIIKDLPSNTNVNKYTFIPKELNFDNEDIFNDIMKSSDYIHNKYKYNILNLFPFINFIKRIEYNNNDINCSQSSITITDKYIELHIKFNRSDTKEIYEIKENAGNKYEKLIVVDYNNLYIKVYLDQDNTMEYFVILMFFLQEYIASLTKGRIAVCDIILKSNTHKYNCLLVFQKHYKNGELELFDCCLLDPFKVTNKQTKEDGIKLNKLINIFLDFNNKLNNEIKPKHAYPFLIKILKKKNNPYVKSTVYNTFYMNVLMDTLKSLKCIADDENLRYLFVNYENRILDNIPLDYFLDIIVTMTSDVSNIVKIGDKNLSSDQFVLFSLKYTLNLYQMYLNIYSDLENNYKEIRKEADKIKLNIF